MKITGIEINDILGIHSLSLQMPKPITVIGAPNGAGKSSIAECIRMVFGEDPARVMRKGDYPRLVHNKRGAKKGLAALTIDSREDDAVIELPKATRNQDFSDLTMLPFVLSPEKFSKSTDDVRRKVLFSLSGQKMNTDAVAAKLNERGCNGEKSKVVLPYLRGGFPAAATHAEEMAKESRTLWKAVSGETYGSTKAETWMPEVQGQRPTAEQIEQAKVLVDLAMNNTAPDELVGALRAKKQAHDAWLASQPEDLPKAIERAKAKIEADKKGFSDADKMLKEAQEAAATVGRVGLVHDLAKAIYELQQAGVIKEGQTIQHDAAFKALAAYVAQYGEVGGDGSADAAQAAEKLPEYTRAVELMANTLDNSQKALEKLLASAEADEPEKVSDAEIVKALAAQEQAKTELKEATELHQQLLTIERQHAEAETAGEKAKQHHVDVLEWVQIKEALEPAGIPSEFLKAALDPINGRLHQSAVDTGWPQVVIDEDMTVTFNGYLYGCVSVSEQYRADVMLAEAISHFSGLRFMLADAFDVLEPAARSEFLGWLDTLAVEGEVDSVIALATMANPPQSSTDTFNTFWLEKQ